MQDAGASQHIKDHQQLQAEDQKNLNPNGEEIFNDVEGTYLVSLLKKKASCAPAIL
jgi:hypothetical protein